MSEAIISAEGMGSPDRKVGEVHCGCVTGTSRQRASHGERALLPLRTFEVGVAHAYEYDSRLALHGNQLDDIRRYGGVLGMQAQSDCQYFRNACSDGKPCIAWPQQRQHGDRLDVVRQSLFCFG